MPKMGREGPAPERLRVDVWTNRKRDPELVEWLWRNPRVAGKIIRELLRAYLAEEGARASSPVNATASLPPAEATAPAASVAPVPGAPAPPRAEKPVTMSRHDAAPTTAPAPPASSDQTPARTPDVRAQPRSRPDGEAAHPAPAQDSHVTPAEAPKVSPRQLQQPRETKGPNEASARPLPSPMARQRAPLPAPAPSPVQEPAPARAPAPAHVPLSAPPPHPPATPPRPLVEEPPAPDQASKVTQVHMTPEAERAKEALMKLVRSAPKPSR